MSVSDQEKHSDIKRKSIRGGVVTFISQFVTILVQMISIIVMARLLSPSDYGILAMVSGVTAFAQLFRDLGLSSAVVRHKELTNIQQSNIFWINVSVGACLTIMVSLSSPLIARFYEHTELKLVSLVASFNFLFTSFGSQSQALLIRNMKFERIAFATVAGSVANLILTLILGFAGFSYWSIVFGNLLGAMLTSVMLFTLSEFSPQFPSFNTSIAPFLSFGVRVTFFDFINYFQRNLDNILIGYNCTAGDLGFYNRSYSLLMFPIQSIRSPISSVAYPAMSKLQESPKQLNAYFLKTVEIIAFMTMPLTAVLAVIAKPFIIFVLGPGWEPAAPIFTMLALVAFIQPSSGFAGSLLLSLGKSKTYLYCGVFNTTITCVGFLIGVNWGAYGVAVSYAISNYIVLVPWLLWAFKQTPVSILQFFNACVLPAFVAVACAAGASLIMIFYQGDLRLQLLCAVVLAGVFGAIAMVSSKKGRNYIMSSQNAFSRLVMHRKTSGDFA